MKLCRFGVRGKEKPGLVLATGERVDVSQFGEDYNEAFFGSDGIARLQTWFASHQKDCPRIDPRERVGACVARPSKIICIGMNYRKHALEVGVEIPKEPVVFFKATSSLTGPNDDVLIPRGSKKTDWEVELAVVIGKRTTYVSEQDALEHVAGYCLHNDYSEREYQLEHGGQWVKGKSFDTFAPLGPFLATRDEIPNPHTLSLWLNVNGQKCQSSNTSDLIFNIPALMSYLSRFMTLLPGDVISTGTPSGVGLGRKPPSYLRPGDIVELGIDSLGTAKQKLVAYDQATQAKQ